MFFPHPRVKVSIVGSLRDREVACSASDGQGSNFEYCVWRTVSSQSSHNPQEALLAQFSLYVHKCGLKPDSLHLPPNPYYAAPVFSFVYSICRPVTALIKVILFKCVNNNRLMILKTVLFRICLCDRPCQNQGELSRHLWFLNFQYSHAKIWFSCVLSLFI